MKYRNYLGLIFMLCTVQVSWSSAPMFTHAVQVTPKPLVVVNGYIVRFNELAKIKEDMIESRVELNAEEGIKIFGETAKDGAIVIILKRKIVNTSGNKVDEAVLQQIEELTVQKEAFSKELKVEEKMLLEGAVKPEIIQEPRINKEAIFTDNQVSPEFSNQLQIEFEKSIKNTKISTVKINGKQVTKEVALMLNVFDIESAISTYKENSNDGVLEIFTIEK